MCMGRTRHSSNIRTARGALALALIGITGLAACSGDDDDAASGTISAGLAEVDAVAVAATEAPAATVVAADEAAGSPGGVPEQTGGIDLGTIGRDVIVELHVQMETDDIARTVAAITADAVNVGGGVASSDISYGTESPEGEPNRDGHAVLVLKVPPGEVSKVIGNLAGTGRVLSVNQSAQDVTDQLVDLDVRIANKRESVENVRNMMAQTTDLGQLVTLENELTWRQTELEQLEAQQRNLGDRVALSTITIEVRPTPAPVADTPDVVDEDESIGDAFRQGWDAFGEVLFGIGFVLAALAPFIVTGAVVAFVAWVIVRVRRRPLRPAEAGAEAPPAPSRDDELTPV